MNKLIDKGYDSLLYLTIAILFIGSIYYVIDGILSEPNLIEAASLLGMGIALSLFLFWLKSWGGE